MIKEKMMERAETLRARSLAFSYSGVLLILAAALLLRLFWVTTQTVIENEGAEYARIAENLFNSVGYVGTMEGPQLYFPPFYPVLIAALIPLTGSSELAGRLVSALMGAALVLPVFAIAARLFSRRVGIIAALIVTFNPMLVALSASVYSESTFLALVMAGIYFGMRALEARGPTPAILAGLFFGLAYLTRPEAIGYAFLTAALLALLGLHRKQLKATLPLATLLVVTALLVASPYIYYLYTQTGKLRLEGKSNIVYTIGQRINSGMSYHEATYGISNDLKEEGPNLNLNAYVNESPYSKAPGVFLSYLATGVLRNAKGLAKELATAFEAAAPLLILLGFAGLRRKWPADQALAGAYAMIIALAMTAILLAGHAVLDRYIVPLLPFLIIWGAGGIDTLYEWARGVAASRRMPFPNLQQIGIAVMCVMCAVFLLSGLGVFGKRVSRDITQQEAGLWLSRNAAGPRSVMDNGTITPYYAQGTWVPFPYADSALALRYIEYKRPSFIVLIGAQRNLRPYLQDWITSGIPHPKATLVYRSGETPDQTVAIYAWDGAPLVASQR
jgi:4-amino-4-deoxy-L-arabinose transferase-like glycosyltransferase